MFPQVLLELGGADTYPRVDRGTVQYTALEYYTSYREGFKPEPFIVESVAEGLSHINE